VLVSFITGVIPSIGNVTFGKITKAMVEKGSNLTCPPPPSNVTSPFMKEAFLFTEYQCALGAVQFICGYIFVTSFNAVAENQVSSIPN
jgi:hypothetical protein